MNDKEIMENILITTKGVVDLYMHGTVESATPNVHGTFNTALNSALCMQSDVYKEMADKGWLSLENLVNSQNTGVYGYMYQQLRKYDATSGQFGLENTEAARNRYLQDAEFRNTDWFDLLFTNSVQQNHSVSISGGTDRSQNYFSIHNICYLE